MLSLLKVTNILKDPSSLVDNVWFVSANVKVEWFVVGDSSHSSTETKSLTVVVVVVTWFVLSSNHRGWLDSNSRFLVMFISFVLPIPLTECKKSMVQYIFVLTVTFFCLLSLSPLSVQSSCRLDDSDKVRNVLEFCWMPFGNRLVKRRVDQPSAFFLIALVICHLFVVLMIDVQLIIRSPCCVLDSRYRMAAHGVTGTVS
jgi:hypothetical protein